MQMANQRIKWSLIGVVLLGSITFTAWSGGNRNANAASTNALASAPQIGYRVPPFSLPMLGSNKTISTKDLVGKPVFINFWTSWCTYCRLEAPDVVKAYKKYGDKVEFLSINVTSQDSMPAIQAFVHQYGMTWQVPLDTTGQVAKAYQIVAFPTSFFVTRSGLIEDKVVGSLSSGTLNADLEAISK